MRLLRPFLCAALVLAATLPAQQAAPLDAKTQQQYERLLRHRYTRDLTEVFAAMEKSAKVDARAKRYAMQYRSCKAQLDSGWF